MRCRCCCTDVVRASTARLSFQNGIIARAAHRTLPFGTVLRSSRAAAPPSHGDRPRSVHRRVPGSIAGGCERAWMPLRPSQRDRDRRANGLQRNRRQQRPSTTRCCGSYDNSADRGRHASVGNVRIHNGQDSHHATKIGVRQYDYSSKVHQHRCCMNASSVFAERAFTRGPHPSH
jgi:hypothetical protein